MTDASLAPAVLETSGSTPPAPWPLIEACGLPEIGRQLGGLSVHIAPELSRAWVLDGTTVKLRPDRAASVSGAALILHEAIELQSVGEHAPDLSRDGGAKPVIARSSNVPWADRIVAHASAIVFGATVLARRGEPGALTLFSPVADAADDLMALHNSPADSQASAAEGLARRIGAFLEERDESAIPCPDDEIERAARALPYALPADVLLASGGDDRQTIDWHAGTNSYGIAPGPTPWTVSLGSCTASAPSFRAFDAAAQLRRELIAAALDDDLEKLAAEKLTMMRSVLLAALGIHDDTPAHVVFTPSGTDAEMVALFAALGAGEPVHSVVVAPREIGSGSSRAAIGQHFCDRAPSGAEVSPGQPLDGFPPDLVTTSLIDVRDETGVMHTPDEVEAAVAAELERNRDRRCLIHVVEGSKTGIRLPRAATLAAWREQFGDTFDIVVDAAQMRIDQSTAINHLENGCMVIVTGSKFFGGPPFSGAVLIPEALTSRLTTGAHLAPGIGDYLARVEVPEALTDLADAARPAVNAGLLLRWEAALAEMRSFHNVSPEIRDEVIRRLAAGILNIVERTPHVQLVDSPYTNVPEQDDRGLDDLPTIFTFLAMRPDGSALPMDQARAVYKMLSRDLQPLVDIDDAVLGRTYQLGQPVRIFQHEGSWIGGLRIAIGAPTVSEVGFDYTRGRTWMERIDRTLADVSDALHKLGLILEHVDLSDA